MNTNSNTYTVIYASIIVVVVAFLLAFVSKVLEPKSQANERIDKKKQILAALNIRNVDKTKVEETYDKVIVADEIIKSDGTVVNEGRDKDKAGFLLASKDVNPDQLPVYICNVEGDVKYVFPLTGKGLWGAIRGYIALNKDRRTVYGAFFTHDSETAGLGARITEEAFQDQFKDKIIRKEQSGDIILSVTKFGGVKNPEYECDGISGATLTVNGVSAMFRDCLSNYKVFLTAND